MLNFVIREKRKIGGVDFFGFELYAIYCFVIVMCLIFDDATGK